MPATATNAPAFKEWAVVVRALLAGEQILDVRKGGIREDRRHFALHSSRFWLYPTVEHQEPALVKPAYRHWIDETIATAPPDRAIRVKGWADVAGVTTIENEEQLARLDGKLIWSSDYVESRLRWKSRDPLWVLALRVHRLLEPIVVPWNEAYGGCTSWVPLDGLPGDPATLPSEPAVSAESFEARVKLVENDLPQPFTPPEIT